MLNTKIKLSLKQTYAKTNNLLIKNQYKNEAIFTMNHFMPR